MKDSLALYLIPRVFATELGKGSPRQECAPARARCSRRLAPAGYLENDTVARDIMLHAHVEVRPRSIEDAASPLRVQVVERSNPHTAVRKTIGVGPVFEA